MKHPLRIGLFGIGLDTYWSQFKRLKPRLEGYVRSVQKKLERPGVEVVNLGLIDNPVKALEAGHKFREADVDVIFLARDDLRVFIHRAARGAARESSRDHPESRARSGD